MPSWKKTFSKLLPQNLCLENYFFKKFTLKIAILKKNIFKIASSELLSGKLLFEKSSFKKHILKIALLENTFLKNTFSKKYNFRIAPTKIHFQKWVLLNHALTSTQHHPSPPSSIHLHPTHFSLLPALCNTLNVIRTKILHVIGQFPQI